MTNMTDRGFYLQNPGYLSANQYLRSQDGNVYLVLQSDGNLCVYEGGPTPNNRCLWSYTSRPPGGTPDFMAVMQNDGNFVVYRGRDPHHPGDVCWAWTDNPPGPGQKYFAVIQNDGNFVIYAKAIDAQPAVWNAGSQSALLHPVKAVKFHNRTAGGRVTPAFAFNIQWNGGESERSMDILPGQEAIIQVPRKATGQECWTRSLSSVENHDSGDNFQGDPEKGGTATYTLSGTYGCFSLRMTNFTPG